MAKNTGTLVIAEVRPYDSADAYPTVYGTEVKGGIHTVADAAARNAITTARREWGMLAYQEDTQEYYTLRENYSSALITDNANWVVLNYDMTETGTRTVIVDPNLTAIPGKVYNTWAAADAYVATQVPAVATPWTIMIYGSNAENITLRNYTRLRGIPYNTLLSGDITTNSAITMITDCKLTGTVNIVSGAGSDYVVMEGCEFEGTLDMDSSGGGSCFVSMGNGCKVDLAGMTHTGAAVGFRFTFIVDSDVSGGVFTASTGNELVAFRDCRIGGSTLSYAEYDNCTVESNTFAAGYHQFTNCTVGSITLSTNDWGVLRTHNCVFDELRVTLTAGSDYEMFDTQFETSNVTIGVVPTQFKTINCSDSLIIGGAQAASWVNEGAIYDNTTSGLTATDVQAAIDEIAAYDGTDLVLSAGYAAASGNPAIADQVEVAIEKLDGNVDAVNTSLGTAQGATHLGTFTGSTISDNTTVKNALQELETALEAGAGATQGTKTFNIVEGVATEDSWTGISDALPTNAVVTKVQVNVATAFTGGTAPTLALRTAVDTTSILAVGENDLETVDNYIVDIYVSASTRDIEYYYTDDGATAGTANVVVYYVVV